MYEMKFDNNVWLPIKVIYRDWGITVIRWSDGRKITYPNYGLGRVVTRKVAGS